jgi:surface polysaccharide O-acyltransferase-like enzyme
MELHIYNGEYFERNKVWYTIFFLIIGVVVIGAFLSKNVIGAVIILLFVGGYFFFLIKTNESTTIHIEEN